MIRVLLADPEKLMREMLAQELARELDLKIVGEAVHGEEAVRLARRTEPDVLLLRLLQPGLNGVQIVERVRTFAPAVGVVLLTSVEGTEVLGELAGGLRCLNTHHCSLPELLATVRRAHSLSHRSRQAPSDMRAAVAWVADLTELTVRETEVLEHVVCTDMSVSQIGRALSSASGERVTDAAVRHAVARLMNKLRVEPRTRLALVKRVLEMGARSAAPPHAN